MVKLWYTRIKYRMSYLSDIPERYYSKVLDMLIENGYYDSDGNRIKD